MAWLDPEGGFFGIVAPSDGRIRIRFWLGKDGVQHPDAWAPCKATITPGETWRPERPVWVVVAMGKGGQGEWGSLVQEVSR